MSFFAQATNTYTYNISGDENTFMGIGFGTLMVFFLVWVVLSIIGMWRVFEKAGESGWKALIPVYNYWVLCEIVGRPGYWALSFFLALIPLVGWIIPFIVSIIVALDLGKAFSKSTLFSVVSLIVFPFVGLMILGFGDAKYHRPTGSAPKPA